MNNIVRYSRKEKMSEQPGIRLFLPKVQEGLELQRRLASHLY
jgi:hypothetical protein